MIAVAGVGIAVRLGRPFLVVALMTTLVATGSRAAQDVYPFAQPSQPLEQALTRFVEITGLQLLYDTDLARGRTSSPVQGRHEAPEALALMLVDTGLSARFTAAGAVVIYAGSSSAVTLSPITAVAPPVIGRPTGGAEARAYAEAVQRLVVGRLRQTPELSTGDYEISVRLWVAADGAAERVEIISGSGDRVRDAAFVVFVRGLAFDAPPTNLPQPIRVAFRVRPAG